LSIKDSLDWFLKQEIDYKNYRAEFIRHSDKQLQSTIFVVNSQGIFGEIITGGHYQLTQGFYDSGHPITFSFDFKKLVLSEKNKKLQLYVKKLISIVKVSDIKLQKKLSKKLQAKFTNNYLNGYFETVDTEDYGLSFEDYNRILGDLYNTTVIPARRFEEASTLGVQAGIQKSHLKSGVKQVLHGHIACPGKVTGIVGQEILVCEMTTPDMVPQMKKAKGIITDFGGILSHAAIIARELNIPCLVGTKNATQILKAGYLIELDADQGVVRVASK
jgi:phosphohistidine swiveling domain-containing protein